MATAASPPVPAGPKPFWDVVLTATPVVLAVLGTTLAGLAGSEMNQSQYHRALAVQAQAKTSDQWGFFQAKNIRRRALEISLAQMPSLTVAGKWDADRFVSLANHLAALQGRSSRQLQALRELVGATAKPGEAPEVAGLRSALQRLGPEGDTAQKTLVETVKRPEAAPIYTFLGTGNLPFPPNAPAEPPALKEALAEVKAGRSERQMAAKLIKHDLEVLRKVIEESEANARTFEEASKPVEEFFSGLERPLSGQLAGAEALHRLIVEVETIALSMPEEVRKPFQADLQELRTTDGDLRDAANELGQSIHAVREDYNARRYQFEGEYNKKIAYLYEVLVRYEGAISELHLLRSRNLFFGMLCAQAGVVIASTALAARYKNVLWALAGLAGFTALVISLYVYLW